MFAPQWDDPATLPGALAAGRRASFGINTMAGLGDRMLLEVRDVLNSNTNWSTLGAVVFFLPLQAVGVVLLQVRDVMNSCKARSTLGAFVFFLP